MTRLVLATRGSALALWQAHRTAERLAAVHPGLEIGVIEVRTTGDRVQDRPLEELSATGVFTKEVDREVIEGRADAAVHSLKDQLTTLEAGLVLGMVLPRGPAEDALVAPGRRGLADLPPGSRVATGSLRRRAQLLHHRPDLELVAIRGNVGTRLEKLAAGEADALVLARAGLERLGFGDRITEVFPLTLLLSAVSQGIVGITCRADDQRTRALLAAADDEETHVAARAERAFLRALGGGCNVPAAAHARVADRRVEIVARVLDQAGGRLIEAAGGAPVVDAEMAGETVAEALIARGARRLLEGV